MKSKFFILISFVIIIGIVFCVIRSNGGRIRRPENIILISIDTIRADHLSCYGYGPKTTPAIDSFAKRAVLFGNCFSNIPLTLPAHASMLTGLIPPAHGVQDNMEMALSESVLTLPEILQGEGYSTYGIISAEMMKWNYGLNQGFDVYDDEFDKADGTEMVAQRTGDETTDHAIKWLDENQDKKKFMFIHLYDPHREYSPPAPYDKQFQDPYDGEIAFTDHCIGRFLDRLKALGQYDDSLIIITGDHGEMLGEHGEQTHGYYIYQNVLRVPLIIKPAGHSSQIRVTDNTSLTDITPTILSQDGYNIGKRLDGVDLSGCFTDKGHRITNRFIFNECLTATKYNGNSLLGVINDKWHYIQTTHPELYDRLADPQELNNLIDTEPKRAGFLKKQLRDILERCVSVGQQPDSGLNYESRQALKSLGYVGGSVDTDVAFDKNRTDPKDLLSIHNKINRVMDLAHDKDYDEAIRLCKAIIAERPDVAQAYKNLAEVYVELQEYDKAIELMQKQLTIVGDNLSGLRFLYEIYNSAGRNHEAIDCLNIILEKDPENALVYGKLIVAYLKLKQYDKAVACSDDMLSVWPDRADLASKAASLFDKHGRAEQAIRYWTKSLEIKPDQPEIMNNLAWLKATHPSDAIRDPAQAIALAQQACKLVDYKNPVVLDTLSVAYAAAGQFADAVRTAEKALSLSGESAKLTAEIRKRLQLYKASKPYRERERTQ